VTTLPNGWTEVALGEVCEIVMGQAPKGSTYNDGGDGWPLIAGAGDFSQGLPRAKKYTTAPTRLSVPGDIVLGIRASIGAKVLADDEYCLGRGVAALRATDKLDKRFLWHWLTVSSAALAAKGRGATFLQVNRRDIAEMPLPLPPLEEQRRIAAILDKADELRAKRRAALEQLDSLTQAIFLDMFGDPVANPQQWPTRHLAELVRGGDRINYGVVQPGNDDAEGVPIVRVGDLLGGSVRMGPLKRISAAVESKYARSRLRGDELLISCVGSIGTVAFASPDVAGFNIARAVTRVPLNDQVNRIYVGHFLRSARAQRYFADQVRTVAQPTLNIKQIKECPVLLPPLELQGSFAATAERVAAAARRGLCAAETLGLLSASLQTRAFRGEL
jgi:type I restriction enzyme S subunit